MSPSALAIRPLRPSDVLAYIAFRRARPVDQGVASLNGGPPALRELLPWVEPHHHQVWVARADHGLVGLLGVTHGPGLDTWAVDRIVCLPGDAEEDTRRALLRHLCGAAAEEGIQKVFLRTAAQSPLVESAALVGFARYATEDLYRLPAVPRLPSGPPPGLRPRRGRDHHTLFRLYCAAVPSTVREAEGMTLQEWRWADGWGLRRALVRLPLGAAQRRDYVLVQGDSAVAWLRVERRGRRATVLAHPDGAVPLEPLVRFALAKLEAGGEAFCTVRDYQGGLSPTLELLGFRPLASYALLVRTLAVRVRERKLVPVRA